MCKVENKFPLRKHLLEYAEKYDMLPVYGEKQYAEMKVTGWFLKSSTENEPFSQNYGKMNWWINGDPNHSTAVSSTSKSEDVEEDVSDFHFRGSDVSNLNELLNSVDLTTL